MSLFHGTVGFYRQYRPGIPNSVADVLDAAVDRSSPRRLLDVGTGTGLVAEALLGRFDDIIAIDNDADMIAATEDALRPALPQGTTLALEVTTAEEFTPPAGWLADLVTICRAFHWLDQAPVLARLNAQVSPHGAVAIFGDNSTGVQTWGQSTDGSTFALIRTNGAVKATADGPLWGEIETAYTEWQTLGQPERHRFGITAGQHQWVWLDNPDHVITELTGAMRWCE